MGGRALMRMIATWLRSGGMRTCVPRTVPLECGCCSSASQHPTGGGVRRFFYAPRLTVARTSRSALAADTAADLRAACSRIRRLIDLGAQPEGE